MILRPEAQALLGGRSMVDHLVEALDHLHKVKVCIQGVTEAELATMSLERRKEFLGVTRDIGATLSGIVGEVMKGAK